MLGDYWYVMLAAACLAALIYAVFTKDAVDAEVNAAGFSFTLRTRNRVRRRRRRLLTRKCSDRVFRVAGRPPPPAG